LSRDLEMGGRVLQEKKAQIKLNEAVLREASVKKESLSTLRGLALGAHRKKLALEEQKTIDEMVILRQGGRS